MTSCEGSLFYSACWIYILLMYHLLVSNPCQAFLNRHSANQWPCLLLLELLTKRQGHGLGLRHRQFKAIQMSTQTGDFCTMLALHVLSNYTFSSSSPSSSDIVLVTGLCDLVWCYSRRRTWGGNRQDKPFQTLMLSPHQVSARGKWCSGRSQHLAWVQGDDIQVRTSHKCMKCRGIFYF